MSQKLATAVCVNLVVLTMAASARGALIGQVIQVKNPPGTPFNAPEAALPSPWVSYQFSIVSTVPSELIGAVDVSIKGNVLHQRWSDVDFDGVTDPSPQNPAVSDGRGDSHLTAPAGSPFGFGPFETNTKSGSPLTNSPGATEYGLGNLSGAWGILNPSTTANIAYLVFKSTDIPVLDITVKAASPTGVPFNTVTNLFACLGCVPPRAPDDVIDNVNSDVPGFLQHQVIIPINSIDPITLTNFAFDSFTPPPGDMGTGPASPASLDSATRKFTWNTVGSPIGSYKWIYTASNVWGSDPGSITVNITVPEPATIVLLSLVAMVFGSCARRRTP